MGRKSNSKGKEKRLQRKEEQLKISASKAIVDQANKLEDPLAPFPVFSKFNKNGLEAELTIKRVKDLDNESMAWVFDLTKRNMKQLYESCAWGWNEKRKLEEMTEDEAWYLIVKSSDGKYLGFSHFRFDLDYGDEVLYCYELQLESSARRHGLGKFMMQLLELIAFTNNMKKIILTSLKQNTSAKSFFSAMNYQIDETSPEDDLDNEYPYEILSKYNKRLVDATPKKPHSQCCSGHNHVH